MPASVGILRLAASLSVAVTVLSAGCSQPAETPAVPVETYAMRGEIVRLPAAGSREIAIRHEAVADFRDEGGKVVGMEAMTMPFTLAPEVDVAGLTPGDKVAFTLEMRWKATSDIVRISRIERLPAGTMLSWESSPAPTPTPETGADSSGSQPK